MTHQTPRYFHAYPKAIPNRPNLLAAELCTHILNHRVDNGIHPLSRVSFQPGHQIKRGRGRPIELDRVAVEQIRHRYHIPIRRKLISNELRVDEPVANDVREDENSMLG